MYYYILNVGLRDGEQTDFTYKKEYVELAVKHAFRGLPEPRTRITHKGDEPTAVVMVVVPRGHREDIMRSRVQALSELMNQDCIAVWNCTDGTGELIGHDVKRAQKWGAFDAKYFQI